jgi:hypothetical protein
VSLGSVTLELRDDPSEVRTAVMGRDGQFRFLYVPEADYVLKTQDAADSVTAVTSNGAARPNQEDIPTHQYGSAQVSLHVGDGSNTIILTVPEREPIASASQ